MMYVTTTAVLDRCNWWTTLQLEWKVDGDHGILVAVFILWSGIGLARDTISPLLGEGVKSDFEKN